MPKLSIARQMILALLLPTLLIGGGLLMFVALSNKQTMSMYNHEKMNNKLVTYSAEVTNLLTRIELESKLLVQYANYQFVPKMSTSSPVEQRPFLDAFSSYAKALSQNHPGIRYNVYFLPQGSMYEHSFNYQYVENQFNSAELPPKTYFTQNVLDKNKQWFYKVFKSGAESWTGPYEKENGQESALMLTYSLPVYSGDNVIAVVSADYPLADFQKTLSAMTYYKTGYVALFDKDLAFISHPVLKPGQTLTEQVGESYRFIETSFNTSESGQLSYKWIDGKNKVLVFKKLPNQWLLSLTAYEDEVFFQSHQLNQQLVIAFFIILGGVCLFSVFLGRGISRPLTRLTMALSEVPENRNVIIEELRHKPNEIGTLAQRLSDYLKLIEVEAENLADYNENLDQMVAQRSNDLIQANAELLQKQEAIQQRQSMLKLQNEHLEQSIQEMVSAERKLVDHEKMASYRELLTRVSTEIKEPLKNANESLKRLQENLAALKIQLKVDPSAYEVQAFCEAYQKNNRRLFSNLIFAKDIVDYIKDLARDTKNIPPDTLELGDYLVKASALLRQIDFDAPIKVNLPEIPQIFIQLDATKFLHLLNSLLLHMGTRENPTLAVIDLHIEIETHASDLVLLLSDFSAIQGILTVDNQYKTNLANRLAFSMVTLLMKEGFGGRLELDISDTAPQLTYKLYFPNVIVDENV